MATTKEGTADDRVQFWSPVDTTTDLSGQPVAKGAHVWELSWSRRKGLMRCRLEDGREWYFRAANGKCKVLHADSVHGRMFIRAKMVVQDDGSAFFYRAKVDKK